MTDYSEIYSMLFTGIIILFLFLTVHDIILNFQESYSLILKSNFLSVKGLNYSTVLKSDELKGEYFVNLESGEEYGSLQSNFSVGFPLLILEGNNYYIARVIVGE